MKHSNYVLSGKLLFMLLGFVFSFLVFNSPLSFAEFSGIGRVNFARDGEFSLVRPDGASRRARRQYQIIQEPAGQTMWAAFSGYALWLLTKSNSPAVRLPHCLTKNQP